MKTDYAALGKKALGRLERKTQHASKVQTEFLMGLLRENRNTEFGVRHGFSHINSVKEYRDKVPLSYFSDYKDDIERVIRGEENVLTKRSAVYFCISSGTTGEQKYIPLTRADLFSHYIYMYGAVFGQIREYYRDLDERDIFGKIFQVGEFAKTYMPDGRMNGIRSGCIYQWLDRNGEFDASDYCVPKEVLFPEAPGDALYMKVRFALADRDLTAIHGVFASRVAGMLEYIVLNFDKLLNDMERGTVSVDTDSEMREYILKKLPPNPERAQELRSIPRRELQNGLAKKLWRKLRYILAINGESFSYHTEKLREYAGDVPIHSFVYAASEGIFGLAESAASVDRYILLPDSVFFEFIPENNDQAKPLLLSEVKMGGRYELVITNRSGLYRCRMEDVIEVVGMYGEAPVVKFCYRKNQVINLAGEKSNVQQLDRAAKHLSSIMGIEIKGYCVGEDLSGTAPGYVIYLECGSRPGNAAEILEKALCEANGGYASCLMTGEIKPLRVEFLSEGSFKEFEKKKAQSGKAMAQSKAPRLLNTNVKRAFFEARVIRRNKT